MDYFSELRRLEFEAIAAAVPWPHDRLFTRYKIILGQSECPIEKVIQSYNWILSEYKQREVCRLISNLTRELNLPAVIVPLL
jgi:hypothetical protein